ncbi:MAG: ketopantoate reductase family protein [Thermodesulfobacteriota bacterium]|jgi:2-dehydropantoate 2-reductase
MRTVVIGPGALGSLFAVRLFLAGGHEVRLLDHDPQRAALLNEQGFSFAADGKTHRLALPVTTDPAAIAEADLLLLCVKAPAVAAALARLRPHWPPGGLLLAFQNGISHLDPLASLPPSCRWGLGVTTEGANLSGPGQVRHGGQGLTRLGFIGQQPERVAAQLAAVAEAFSAAGLASEVVADIRVVLWQKLLVNVGINALTALYDCPNGGLPAIPSARARLIAAVAEGARVAAAQGIVIPADPVALTLQVCRDTAANISSMLQDVRNRRLTEIGAINGAIVVLGERLAIPTPVNRELTQAIRALEQGFT